MPYGNINVDTVTTSTSGGILGAGNASIMKNRIINGAMVIDQRYGGASVSNPTSYTLDRWNTGSSQASKITIQQNAGSVTPPVGFSNYLGVTSTSAYSIVSSDYFDLLQNVEGFNFSDCNWGTADAKTVTLSFWVRSSLTGTFGGSLANSGLTRSYPFSYTISAANTWEQKSITIAGDTTGTWVGATNGIGVRLWIGLGVGSTYSGTAGTWAGADYRSATGATSVVGTNGATFYITGVQLEVGSSATGFEYRQYQQELALCQRFFQVRNFTGDYAVIWTGDVTTGNTYFYTEPFPVSMRAAPTGVMLTTNQDQFNAPAFTRTIISGMVVNAACVGTGARKYFQFNYTVSAEL
jgi:hypothetical protein